MADLTWVAVGDDATCDDCAGRDGTTATMAQWTQWGLPGSGATVCLSNCRCELEIDGQAVEVPPLAEQVKAAEGDPAFDRAVDSVFDRARQNLRNAGASEDRIDTLLAPWRNKDGSLNLRRIPPASRSQIWRAAAEAVRAGE